MTLQGDNMANVKKGNRSVILSILHRCGEMSRKRLASQVKLTPAAITLITGEMIAEGLLSEGGTLAAEGRSGRREIPIRIEYDSFVSLGISINISEAVISATNLAGSLLFSKAVSFSAQSPAEETVGALSEELDRLIEYHKLGRHRIIGLGVGVRGIVDVQRARSVQSFGAFVENNVPVRALFEERTGFLVTLDNNVRSMFRSHRFFMGNGDSSQVFVRCDRGIGGGLSADDQLIWGSRGRCSELGHIPVVESGGKPCFCGKTGCLETVATIAAILSDVSAIYGAERTPILYTQTGGHIENATIEHVFGAAKSGDMQVDAIVQNAASKFSSVLKTIIYTFDPDSVLLYGKIFECDYYLKSLRKHISRNAKIDPESFVKKSQLNLTLEDKAACIIAIETFFEGGGLLA